LRLFPWYWLGMLPAENFLEVALRRFDAPDETRVFEKGRFAIVRIGAMTVGRATYEPGWKWSVHVGARLGQTTCEVAHVGMVVSGCATAAMRDGRVFEMRAGDLFCIAPGHDSWVVGDEPYVSLHFMGADEYAKGEASAPPASPWAFVGVDHVQLAAPPGCEAEARRFFGDLLGLRELPKPAPLAVRGGLWFECGAQQIHVGVEEGHRPARKAHPALRLRDDAAIEALKARLKQAGVATRDDREIEDSARFFAEDPWGNRLEFVAAPGRRERSGG
jgi:catechol 2,3-dioxygenase-like lactoylglutathione lyase family enzyme